MLGQRPARLARDRVMTLFRHVRGQLDAAPRDKLRIVSRLWRASSHVEQLVAAGRRGIVRRGVRGWIFIRVGDKARP